MYVIMTSYDAYTSGTSRVLIVASLQPLKMETFIPVPADYEVRPVIKILNAQIIAPIEIRPLCQVYGHIRLEVFNHIYLEEFGWEMFNHHTPYNPDLAPSDLHLFLYRYFQEILVRSASAFSE